MSVITPDLVQQLLYRSEGETLDFKREQFRFDEEPQKAEFVKDVLAFANAWKDGRDAFVVIGVKKVAGQPPEIVGETNHPDDADLQQLVNGKTNRPIRFSYQTVEFQGLMLGVLHIPDQERPFFVQKRYHRLEPNKVYVRRGSSTDEADPAEIAQMGRAAVQRDAVPTADLQWCEDRGRKLLGTHLSLVSVVLTAAASTARPGTADYFAGLARPVDAFLKRPAGVGDAQAALPASIAVTNTSGVLLRGARVLFDIPKNSGLEVLEDDGTYAIGGGSLNGVTLREHSDAWAVELAVGAVQPRATEWTHSFWLRAKSRQELQLTVKLFGDNIEPVEFGLSIEIGIRRRPIDRPDP